MAHTHNAVAVAPVVAVESKQDVEFSHRAAALLGLLQPRKNSEQVVQELLEQLKVEKLARESRGRDRWDKHASKVLGRIIRGARRERQERYREAAAFYAARGGEVLRFARAIVMDDIAAEAVVSDTYRELLEDKTTVANFFKALVCNARNYLEGEAYRRGKLSSLDEAFALSFGGAEAEVEGGEIPSFEPMSRHLEDQDPLDILIAREEEDARRRLVAEAQEDPRWRYIKRRDWAAPLLADVRN